MEEEAGSSSIGDTQFYLFTIKKTYRKTKMGHFFKNGPVM
jgi:hypothetical protein